MAVPIRTAPFEAGAPVALFQTGLPGATALVKQPYALGRDWRFLINNAAEESARRLMGLPPSRKHFRQPAVFIYDLRGNEIVRERRIYDFTGMLIQIGVLKARPA